MVSQSLGCDDGGIGGGPPVGCKQLKEQIAATAIDQYGDGPADRFGPHGFRDGLATGGGGKGQRGSQRNPARGGKADTQPGERAGAHSRCDQVEICEIQTCNVHRLKHAGQQKGGMTLTGLTPPSTGDLAAHCHSNRTGGCGALDGENARRNGHAIWHASPKSRRGLRGCRPRGSPWPRLQRKFACT